MVRRLDGGMAEIQDFLLDGIDFLGPNTNSGKQRPTVFFLNPDDNVPAAEVVKVIRKGADRMQHVQRVPRTLEFKPLPLDRAAVKKRG